TRAWVTEVRPALLACGKNCAGGPPDECCILLARLDFDIDASWRVVRPAALPAVQVVEDARPFLVHTRLLQEMLLCRRCECGHGTGVVLGNTVVTEVAFDQPPDGGTATVASRADHTHGTPLMPVVPAPGDTVVTEIAFGRASSAGSGTRFSR